MKQVAIAAVALILGIVIGGLGPRQDLRALERKVADLTFSEEQCRSTLGADLAAFMRNGAGGRSSAPSARPAEPKTNPLGDRDPDVLAEENPEAAELAEAIAAEQEAMNEEVAENLENIPSEELELARTALELRRAQARAAIVEDARPDDTQMETIDSAVQEMNDSLMGMADELVTMLDSGEEPTRREAMEFAADALDTMLVAEDAMRGALDDDQLDSLDDAALDPFSYVSPDLVDLLEGLGATPE